MKIRGFCCARNDLGGETGILSQVLSHRIHGIESVLQTALLSVEVSLYGVACYYYCGVDCYSSDSVFRLDVVAINRLIVVGSRDGVTAGFRFEDAARLVADSWLRGEFPWQASAGPAAEHFSNA